MNKTRERLNKSLKPGGDSEYYATSMGRRRGGYSGGSRGGI